VAGTVLTLIPEATRAKLEQRGIDLTELVRAVQDGDATGELVNIREPGGNLIEVTVE
jgi:hypothetical protein